VLKEYSWDKHDETPNINIKTSEEGRLHSGFTPRSSPLNQTRTLTLDNRIVALSWLLASHRNVGVSYSTVPVAYRQRGSRANLSGNQWCLCERIIMC